jgi:hypothetical protein
MAWLLHSLVEGINSLKMEFQEWTDLGLIPAKECSLTVPLPKLVGMFPSCLLVTCMLKSIPMALSLSDSIKEGMFRTHDEVG